MYDGVKPLSVRTWGRDRLQVLARLIPAARNIDVYLAGYGMPSIMLSISADELHARPVRLTDNDWTGEPKFDLLTRRLEASATDLTKAYQARYKDSSAPTPPWRRPRLSVEKGRTALSYLCQIGRAMFDLKGKVFRHRELFSEPFKVRRTPSRPSRRRPRKRTRRRRRPGRFSRTIRSPHRPAAGDDRLQADRHTAKGSDGVRVRPLMHVDPEVRIIEAECTCTFFTKFKLTRGPCEHILARPAHTGARFGKRKRRIMCAAGTGNEPA